ncbi:unnamed protein product, partial [Heterosigma akashiwo]
VPGRWACGSWRATRRSWCAHRLARQPGQALPGAGREPLPGVPPHGRRRLRQLHPLRGEQKKMVPSGGLAQVLKCCLSRTTSSDCVFALANLADSLDLQGTLSCGGIGVGGQGGSSSVQRDAARALACLSVSEGVKAAVVERGALPTLFKLARSLDVASQRYATLALCNLCSGEHKARIVAEGAVRPLMFLARFPDLEIQRYIYMAGRATGKKRKPTTNNIISTLQTHKTNLTMQPSSTARSTSVANMKTMQKHQHSGTATSAMCTRELSPYNDVVRQGTIESLRLAVYALGSLSEHDEVKARLVELGAVAAVVGQVGLGDIEVKRRGVLPGPGSETMEFHEDLAKEGGLEAVVQLAALEDVECQEYAAFALAHLASNRDHQVRLVELGALRPLVSMMAVEAEPRHYAGLALLKLADNREPPARASEEAASRRCSASAAPGPRTRSCSTRRRSRWGTWP